MSSQDDDYYGTGHRDSKKTDGSRANVDECTRTLGRINKSMDVFNEKLRDSSQLTNYRVVNTSGEG